MKDISILELNNLFIDTLERAKLSVINENDETVEYEILEEFDTGATSFLHEKSLNQLMENNYINTKIKELCLQLREMFFLIGEEKRNADSIRNDNEWREILQLAELIREKKRIFDYSIKKVTSDSSEESIKEDGQ